MIFLGYSSVCGGFIKEQVGLGRRLRMATGVGGGICLGPFPLWGGGKGRLHEEAITSKSKSEISEHPPNITMGGSHPTLYNIM